MLDVCARSLPKSLTGSGNARRARDRPYLAVLQQARVRREGDVGALARRDGAEGVAPAVAVARRGDRLHAQRLPHVGDGRGDDGVRHVGAVRGEELRRVEPARVDVARRGCAVEQVRRHGQVAGAGEAVGETGG